jgi:hypothetical protein
MHSSLAYAAFALLALVGPGCGLHRALRLRVDPALVIPLGLAAAAGAYWLSLWLGLPWVGPAALFLLNGLNLNALNFRRVGHARLASGPALLGALPPWLAFVALLALAQFPWNRLDSEGAFLPDPIAPYDDAVFHVGLARELLIGYPPQVPGLSGLRLGYHFGQGLVRAAALRWCGIEPFDAVSRFDPVLVSLALALALRGAAARLGAPPLAVGLAGWTLLATDFSFLFAGLPSAFYWADLLKGNLLFSLAYVNPVAPALAILLGCLIALFRFEAGEGRGWLVLAALQAAALPHFKAFLGVHLLLGLGVAGVYAWRAGRGRECRALGAVALPCAAMALPLALGQARASISLSLAPFDLARITRESLDLPAVHGASFALWCAFWLFCSLGVRWLGVPHALRAFRAGPLAGATLAAMALLAWPLGLLLRIAVADALPGQKVVNDAAYIVEQGGPLLWVFTALALSGLAFRHGKMAAAALCVLALPATVQFVARKLVSPPDPIPAAMVRAAKAIRDAGRPGEVVLQRPSARYPPLPVLLGMQRVPYERYTPFRTQFASREDLERRHEAVFRFFRTEERAEALALAKSLEASYLALYGSDRVRFDASGVLEALHEEGDARAYRIRYPPP